MLINIESVLFYFFVIFFLKCHARFSSNYLKTIAGGGSGSSGSAATSVSVPSPNAVSGDSLGNIYVSETFTCCVRKFNIDVPYMIYNNFVGVCSTCNYNGDGGPATSAYISYTGGTGVDTVGAFYVPDRNNYVRKVSGSKISTFAGGGSSSNLNRAATSTTVIYPSFLWVNSVSDVFVSTWDNGVYKIDASTNILTQYAGGSSGYSGDGFQATNAKFNHIYGLRGTTTGAMYITDVDNAVVRSVTTAGIISTFAGQYSVNTYVENVAATSSGFATPIDVFVDADTYDVYICAQYTHRVLVVTKTTTIINSYIGIGVGTFTGEEGPATSVGISSIGGMFISSTSILYLADLGGNRVRQVYNVGPTADPTMNPTVSINPTATPTTSQPTTIMPTVKPTIQPSIKPSVEPSVMPSQPTSQPSSMPSVSNATNTEFLVKSPGFEVRNLFAFAGLHSDGSVSAWGSSDYGGSIASVSDKLNGDIPVIKIVSSKTAFAALRSDGSVVAWGRSASITGWEAYESYTTINSLVGSEQAFAGVTSDGSVIAFGADCCGGNVDQYGWESYLQSGVVSITASSGAFAALKSDGTVFTWGNEFTGGGVSNLTLSSLTGIVQIAATQGAFAALTDNGDVVVWGDRSSGGSMSSSVSALLSRRVVGITSNWAAFAAHTVSLGVIAWGQSSNGGDYSKVKGKLAYSVKSVSVTHSAFAALKSNGSVVAWGNSKVGGDSSSVSSQLTSVTNVYGNTGAFAAVTSSGGVVVWGDSKSGGSMYSNVSMHLTSGVEAVYHTDLAFIAVKSDGSAVVWGNSHYGGSASDAVSSYLSSNVRLVCTCGQAFTVILRNGTVVSWGNSKSISSAGLQQGMNYSSITTC